MTKDANQIAQEMARREQRSEALQPPRPVGLRNDAPKPRRGTLSVWTYLQNREEGRAPQEQFPDVTVRLDTPGAILLGSEEGSTYLLYPEPGWYVEFVPNDEGE